MKKEIIAILTAGVLLLGLTGCNKSSDAKNTVKEDTTSITTQKAEEQKNTNSDKVKADEKKANNEQVKQEEKKEKENAPKDKVNNKEASDKGKGGDDKTKNIKASEHIQNGPITTINAIQISPKHVYYQDGNLYMEAFVYNGFNHPVYNIRDIKIALSNDTGLIAQAIFPSLQNVQIATNSYITWTFIFGKELINQQNADLFYLATDCSLKNSH